MRCGGFNWRSTAVAAAASGGATTAPSAIAGAHGMAGISVRAATATAMVVRPTAKTARPVTGAQLSLRSLGDASKAASSSTGATKSARASSGSMVNDGAPGNEREDRAAERQKHWVRCADAACRGGQNDGCENQANECFEFPHVTGRRPAISTSDASSECPRLPQNQVRREASAPNGLSPCRRR